MSSSYTGSSDGTIVSSGSGVTERLANMSISPASPGTLFDRVSRTLHSRIPGRYVTQKNAAQPEILRGNLNQ